MNTCVNLEVQKLLPDMTRPLDLEDTAADPVSGLVYSDLIALLVGPRGRYLQQVNHM